MDTGQPDIQLKVIEGGREGGMEGKEKIARYSLSRVGKREGGRGRVRGRGGGGGERKRERGKAWRGSGSEGETSYF